MIWTFIDMKAVILESKERTTTENKISQKFYVFIKAMLCSRISFEQSSECFISVWIQLNRMPKTSELVPNP